MKLFLFITLIAQGGVKERIELLLHKPLEGLPKLSTATPPTVQTAELGRILFFDKRLSRDGTISCASCHKSEFGFGDSGMPVGAGGAVGPRKSQPILNRAFSAVQFWDGRADSLEAQILGPITGHIEMDNTVENAVKTIGAIPGYKPLFKGAFGDDLVTSERMFRAISDFERTLLSGNSRYDRFVKDPDRVPFTEEEKQGLKIFNGRECHICHVPPFFTDNKFHNTGVAFKNGTFTDEGRFGFTKTLGQGKPEELGAFKTPTLREVSKRAPYMHNGEMKSLEEVVEFYNKGGTRNPQLDKEVFPLGLRPADKVALLAFLRTLDGEGFEETEPREEEFPQ